MDALLVILREVGNYVIYWSPYIVGVVVGGLLIQRYWVNKANESALIDYLTKEINDLVDETLEYWSLDCSGTTRRADQARLEARKLEQRIKGALKNLNSVLSQYANRYCKKIDFSTLMVEVTDACTGGNFEVKDRRPDANRFLTVVNTTHRIRWQLFERRIKF